MRFLWMYQRRLAALSGIVVVLHGASLSQAQFAPIRNPIQINEQRTLTNGQTQSYGQSQSYGKPQVFGQLRSNDQTSPQNSPQTPLQSNGQAQPQRVAQNPTANQADNQNQAYRQLQGMPQYTARAFQGAEAAVMPQPVETVVPDNVSAGANVVAGAPSCNNCQSAPSAAYRGSGGFETGGYGYNTFASGSGVGNGLLRSHQNSGRRWFGGIYGLLMDRSSGSNAPLAFATSTTNAPPYYPTDTEIALNTSSADIGYQSGIEVRFGATFSGRYGGGYGGGSSCDVGYNTFSGGASGCSTSCSSGPTHAWETVYWGIVEDSATSVVTDTTGDMTRTYGMIDFRGLEYDPGTGYRSVNVFYDYGPPTVDNSTPYDVEVRSFTTRSRFSAQNVELNLLRLPILNGGSGIGTYGNCSTRPRYELTTLLGARFMRFDEDFYFRTDYERMDTNATGFLAYNAEVDNKLYGFQLGFNGLYRIGGGGRWSLHCSSSVGVYGNQINVRQWMASPTGAVRFANGANGNFDVNSSKDDVAMIGELRLGGSYQYSSNWRFYGGWRAVGVTGVALATAQIPTAFITPGQVGAVASDGSLILHGLQTGVEFTY